MNIASPQPKDAKASIAETLRVGLIIVGFAALLWLLSDIVLLVFTAVLLAVLLRGAASMLTRRTRLPVGISLAVVSLVIVALIVVFGIWVGPRFVSEGKQLIGNVSGFVSNFRVKYGNSGWAKMAEHAFSSGSGKGVGPTASKLVSVTFGTLGGLVLIIVTALYLAAAPQSYMSGTMRLLPLSYRRRGFDILTELGHVLRWWMAGQLIDMAVVGILATLGLFLLGIPLPIALGVLAGLLTFIPYIGAIMAGVPAIIVASAVSPAAILWVILLYLGCHAIEGYIVSPLVQRRTVELPPALTVMSMTVLGVIYGFLGVLIATPLTATIMVLVREIYVHDMLGDQHPDHGSLVVLRRYKGPKFLGFDRAGREM